MITAIIRVTKVLATGAIIAVIVVGVIAFIFEGL